MAEQRDHEWPQPDGWAVFPRGLSAPVRTRWDQDTVNPPRLERIGTGTGASAFRLMEGRPQRQVSEKDRRYVLNVVTILLIVSVLGQRFVLPIGFPIAIPLIATYLAVLLLRLRGGVRYNRVRTELYVLAAAAVVLASWISLRSGTEVSVNSLFLLLILYLPWVFCLASPFSDLVTTLLRRFVWLMVLAASVGVLQMGAQLAGVWAYQDLVELVVPEAWLLADYNTTFPIAYESPIIKSNAFLFLEPSFLCQFCALALIVGILVRAPAWQLLILGLGMASTLSGTGILLLVVGSILIVIRDPRRIRPVYIITGVIGLIAVFLTPAAEMLLERTGETSQQGSSGYLRFVQPYTEVINGLSEKPERYLVGAGPGTSDRLLESDRGRAGEAVVYTIAPKLAFEYGLIAAVLFMAFMLVSISRGPPLPALAGAVIFMIFILSGSLLTPHTVATAWLLTSLWGSPVTLGVSDSLAALRRQRASTPG